MSAGPGGGGHAGGGQAVPLPAGFGLVLDADTKRLDSSVLFGGSPARFLRLSSAGRAALAEVQAGPVSSPAARALARRLTDAGLAHPSPPPLAGPAGVTVIIPAYGRPGTLAGCLAALGRAHPVIVVDDGSPDARAVAQLAADHHAAVVRRPANGGPAAARNTGLAHAGTDLVAFLDSDCVPEPGWIERLATHFADPLVAAAAPRISAIPAPSPASRYGVVRGSLDLGGRPARVMPGSRVSYVPTAALLVRRPALLALARGGTGVFDEELRWGEDVDLIWRLHAAGWRIRYDPAVEVRHNEPASWPALLARRFRYGTSAAPLARRHPGAVPPLVLQPWPALATAALLARRPAVSAAACATSVLMITRTLRRSGLPVRGVVAATGQSVFRTWLGVGHYTSQFAAPLAAAAIVAPARTRRGWGRRAAAASLLLGPALLEWRSARPALDPVRFTLGRIADDACYGAGVWAGCARHRLFAPVRPVISRPGIPRAQEHKSTRAQDE